MTKNRWRQLAEEVRRKADDVTELYAAAIVTTAAAQAPYKYGHLRASIEQAAEGAASARRRIVVQQFYGIFLEKGTERISPRPYLEPAVEQWRDDYLQAIRLVVA